MRHVAPKLDGHYIAPEVRQMAVNRKQVIDLAVQEVEKSVRAMEALAESDNRNLKSYYKKDD